MLKKTVPLVVFCWFMQLFDGSKEEVKEMTLVVWYLDYVFVSDTKPIRQMFLLLQTGTGISPREAEY